MIPVLDLKDADLGSKLKRACREHGFFYLRNHGINSSSLFSLSKDYFSQELEEKMRFPAHDGSQGYVYVGSERLDPKTHPDNKEAFNLRPTNDYEIKKLPLFFHERWSEVDSFWRACHSVCMQILEVISIELELGGKYLSERHKLEDSSATTLRLLHYMPCSSGVRAGLHSDYGTMTLLFQDAVGGLQVIPPGKSVEEGVFIDVPYMEGCIIVNVGDLLQLWTDSFFCSAQHRVIARNESTDRYSIAFFLHPTDDVELSHIVQRNTDTSSIREIERKRIAEVCGNRNDFTARSYLEHRLRVTYK